METRRSWFEQWSAPSHGSCLTCGAPTGGAPGNTDPRRWMHRLCRSCLETIPWITAIGCRSCGRGIRCSDCRRHPLMAHGLAANRSVVQYDAVMKEWLSRFKFKGEIRFAQLLAGMMLERYEDVYQRTELANRSSQSSGFLQGIRDLVVQGNRSRLSYPDVVTFVPSSTERLQDRGFNQAALVAELLAQAWKRPLLPALSRMRDDARQSHQSRSGRERSMQGAYRSNHEVLSRIVSGNSSSVSIMLVDDVFTTGNTLRACTDALRRGLDEAGIKSTIWSYTWARA